MTQLPLFKGPVIFESGYGRAPNAIICACGEWVIETRYRRATRCHRCFAILIEVVAEL